jgi:hypothetical protein
MRNSGLKAIDVAPAINDGQLPAPPTSSVGGDIQVVSREIQPD